MDIHNIVKEFVDACSRELDLKGIIQFGSSTYSDKSKDIDLVFYFNDNTIPTENIMRLMKIIKDFESKHNEIVFDFGGVGDRKRKGKYSITIVSFSKSGLNIFHNPHNLFFIKNISEDKNKKILYGKDAIENIDIKLTNQHLFEMLSVDLIHSLRKALDDERYRLNSSYRLFKTFLRAMLINKGIFKKEELINEFKKEYKNKIKLPKDAQRIISGKIEQKDFEEILKFSEDCLRYLIK